MLLSKTKFLKLIYDLTEYLKLCLKFNKIKLHFYCDHQNSSKLDFNKYEINHFLNKYLELFAKYNFFQQNCDEIDISIVQNYLRNEEKTMNIIIKEE